MPSVFIISAGAISAFDTSNDPTTLGSSSQGAGSHLGNLTISPSAGFTRVDITDAGGRTDYLEDSQSGQSLTNNTVIDGVSYAAGTAVENEFQITLEDGDGNTYTAWAIEIEDGAGTSFDNVVGLAFAAGEVPPFGENLTVIDNLDLFNLPSSNTDEFFYSGGVPCFTEGTHIRTDVGTEPVENIQPGTRIWTRDAGPQEVIWVGQRRVGPAELIARPELRPIVIQPHAVGNTRALQVSPQHRIVWTSGLNEIGFARAKHLALQPGLRFRFAQNCRQVTYIHILCRSHQIVETEGMLSETFYPGSEALRALGPKERQQVLALLPSMASGEPADRSYGPLALREFRRAELTALAEGS